MNIGDKAPEILGLNEKGEEIRLSNYKGKKIVLYFYPKDMTSGCTAQACNLRDNYAELRAHGYEDDWSVPSIPVSLGTLPLVVYVASH